MKFIEKKSWLPMIIIQEDNVSPFMWIYTKANLKWWAKLYCGNSVHWY
jgi:hypothetical protein